MTKKVRATLWLYPSDRRRLKLLAAEADQPTGNVINRILDLVDQDSRVRSEVLGKKENPGRG